MIESQYNGPYPPTFQWICPWSPLLNAFFPSPSGSIQYITEMPSCAHGCPVIHYVIPIIHFSIQVESYVFVVTLLVGLLLLGHSRWSGYLCDVMTSLYSNYANFSCCHARYNNFYLLNNINFA